MVHCPSCGEKMEENWKFCPTCGPLEEIEGYIEIIDKGGVKSSKFTIRIPTNPDKKPEIHMSDDIKGFLDKLGPYNPLKKLLDKLQYPYRPREDFRVEEARIVSKHTLDDRLIGLKIHLPNVDKENLSVKSVGNYLEIEAYGRKGVIYFKSVQIPEDVTKILQKYKDEKLELVFNYDVRV